MGQTRNYDPLHRENQMNAYAFWAIASLIVFVILCVCLGKWYLAAAAQRDLRLPTPSREARRSDSKVMRTTDDSWLTLNDRH